MATQLNKDLLFVIIRAQDAFKFSYRILYFVNAHDRSMLIDVNNRAVIKVF